MKTELVPNASMSFLSCGSSPEINDAITMTVTVPMTTPSTVRKERNLCACKVANAIRKLSVVSCLLISIHLELRRGFFARRFDLIGRVRKRRAKKRPPQSKSIRSKRFNWIELCCLPSRIYPKKQANACRYRQRHKQIGRASCRERV